MAKSRTIKGELLNKYKSLLENKSGFILVDTQGLDTATITTLKMKLKEIGSDLVVVKNSVFKIALQDANNNLNLSDFSGQTAMISIGEDPSIAAKMIKDIQNDKKLMDAKIGTFQGELLSAERVMELADIPSREVLLSKLLGSLTSPISGFMNASTGNLRGFVVVLKGISEK